MKLTKLSITVLGGAVLLYLLLYLVTVPKFLFLRSDDFGYLDSYLQSLKNNRITVSQFLEPYNAFSTLIFLVIYKISSSMYLSTWGMVIILSVINFTLIQYLATELLGIKRGILTAFTITTFPTYLNIAFDMTGIITTWTLFLIALTAWHKKNHLIFYVFAILATINRQSSIVLFIVPLFLIINQYLQHKKIEKKLIIQLLFSISGIIFFISRMNSTIAWKLVSVNLFYFNHFKYTLAALFTGIFIISVILVIFQLVISAVAITKFFSVNIKKPLIPFLLTTQLAVFFLFGLKLIHFQTPVLNVTIWLNSLLYVIFLMGIWLYDWQKIIFSKYLWAAFFLIFLVSLRGIWFDYYFFEIFILCLFHQFEIAKHVLRKGGDIRLNGFYLIIFPLILFNLFYYFMFKFHLDYSALSVKVYEKMLRQKKIDLSNMGEAPFGFLAWKLFPYAVSRNKSSLTEFTCYLSGDYNYRLMLTQKDNQYDSFSNAKVLESGKVTAGFKKFNYYLTKPGNFQVSESKCSYGNRQLPFTLDHNYSRIFPLNDNEWKIYLKNQPR